MSSVNLKEEQARLEDLYQHIFPFLLQTERALQDVASRGKGHDSGDRELCDPGGGKTVAAGHGRVKRSIRRFSNR